MADVSHYQAALITIRNGTSGSRVRVKVDSNEFIADIALCASIVVATK